jgi:hypothetical protein
MEPTFKTALTMNYWMLLPSSRRDSDFLRLFKQREFLKLAGKNRQTILKLSAIIFITLLSLSYAMGSLNVLRLKMENPYTNWVDIPLSSTGQNGYDSLSVLLEYFTRPENKAAFSLNDVRGYVSSTALLVPVNDFTIRIPHKARTIEPGEKILEAILDQKNVLAGSVDPVTVFNQYPCGVIIKQKALTRLGIQDWEHVQKVPMLFYDDVLYVDVVAVVEDLPDYCDFVCTPRFYNLLLNGSIRPHDTGVINQDTTNIVVLASTEGDKKRVLEWAKEGFEQRGFEIINIKKVAKPINDQVSHFQYLLIFNHQSTPDHESRQAFFRKYKGNVVPSVEWNCISDRFDGLDKPYALAFNFNDLGKVRAFKSFMGTRFKMNVNLAQVEAKDNFKKVTQITWVVSMTLFLFGILSIVLFITNLLSTHLQQMRSNLGTLKAFGLMDDWLKNTYNLVIAYFLLVSFITALVPLLIISGCSSLLWKEVPLDVLNLPVLSAILLIFISSIFFARRTSADIVKFTPGDLVYGR